MCAMATSEALGDLHQPAHVSLRASWRAVDVVLVLLGAAPAGPPSARDRLLGGVASRSSTLARRGPSAPRSGRRGLRGRETWLTRRAVIVDGCPPSRGSTSAIGSILGGGARSGCRLPIQLLFLHYPAARSHCGRSTDGAAAVFENPIDSSERERWIRRCMGSSRRSCSAEPIMTTCSARSTTTPYPLLGRCAVRVMSAPLCSPRDRNYVCAAAGACHSRSLLWASTQLRVIFLPRIGSAGPYVPILHSILMPAHLLIAPSLDLSLRRSPSIPPRGLRAASLPPCSRWAPGRRGLLVLGCVIASVVCGRPAGQRRRRGCDIERCERSSDAQCLVPR